MAAILNVLSQVFNFYFQFFTAALLLSYFGWSYEGFPKQERVRSPFESAVARVTSFLAFQISLLFSFFLCRVWVTVPGGFKLADPLPSFMCNVWTHLVQWPISLSPMKLPGKRSPSLAVFWCPSARLSPGEEPWWRHFSLPNWSFLGAAQVGCLALLAFSARCKFIFQTAGGF